MMLTALSLAGMLLTAEPLELIKTEGELVLTDSASFFVFKADGTFQSFPTGMSGRTLSGTWKSPPGEPQIFEVIALHSWLNGVSAPDDYRKIGFAIYSGKTRPFTGSPMAASVKKVFDGYWLIQELTKVPKPKK
jgi:hypothetical protein